MTITTDEQVLVDGTVLNTYAYNVRTLTGRDGIPGRRGENRRVAYRHGQRWQRKRFEAKSETWAMWIVGCTVDGTIPSAGARAQYNDNLLALQRLFGKIHAPLSLERRIRLTTGLLVLTAQAECVGTLDPSSMAGGTRATMTVDLEMADPFWYAASRADTVPSAGATITHPGSGIADRMVIRLNGPSAINAVLTNTTLGVSLTYGEAIAAGDWVDLDTDAFTAVHKIGGANKIAKVSHAGAVAFMEMVPGANVFTLTGGGSATVTWKPPYL